MQKLILAGALAASLFLAGCASAPETDATQTDMNTPTALAAAQTQGAYKDGTYVGTGTGNASHIQVEVVVTGGKVASVKVLDHGETDMLLRAAEKRMAKGVIANNGTEGVDTLSGATNSSKGILEAVNKALEQAK